MITDDHLYSLSTVQYYLFCRAGDEDADDGAADGYVDFCRAGDEDADDGAADGYVDIVFTLRFV